MDDPIAAALDEAGVSLRPAQGPKDLAVGRGVHLPLQPDQRFQIGQDSGRAIRALLEQVTQTPGYQQASPAVQQQILERVVSQARGAVRQQATRDALLQQMTNPTSR